MLNRWSNNIRWSSGRYAMYRWDQPYGIDWPNFTGDPLNLDDGAQPDSRIWTIFQNDGGLAQGLNGKLNYNFPGDDVNYFSVYLLNGYYPAGVDFIMDIGFFQFSSARPEGSDRNYGPKIELRDYSAGYAYRGLCGRCFDAAYNGYVCDSDTISARRFNQSDEVTGRIRLERTGDSLFASRWWINDYYWDQSPPSNIRSGVQSMDLALYLIFEGENNSFINSNAYNFVCTPGLVEREDI